MLAIPDLTAHRSKLTDWFELNAISSPDGRIGFGTLTSAAQLSEDIQAEDILDEDTWQDKIILCVQDEIERRTKSVGADYPFKIDLKGRSMQFVTPLTKAGAVYLFCLFLSHAFDHTIVPKSRAPKVSNKIRDLFQACATIAAGGFVQGPSISFGVPRPDGATFLKALHRVYKLFGDGKPHLKPRPAAPPQVQDNGIDVIAWRRSKDGLPCTLYMIGQVASGADWKGKSVKSDRIHFHEYWFTQPPASQPLDAMFMPFGLEPPDPEDGTPYEEVLSDYMSSNGHRYGQLFYRDRIAHHVSLGLDIVNRGEKEIERVQDLSKVATWVNNYAKRLKET